MDIHNQTVSVSSNKHKIEKYILPVLNNMCYNSVFQALLHKNKFKTASQLLSDATRDRFNTKIHIIPTNQVCRENAIFEIKEKDRLSLDIKVVGKITERLRPLISYRKEVDKIFSSLENEQMLTEPVSRPLAVFDGNKGGLFIYIDVTNLSLCSDRLENGRDIESRLWGALATHKTNQKIWVEESLLRFSTMELSKYPSTHYIRDEGVVKFFIPL